MHLKIMLFVIEEGRVEEHCYGIEEYHVIEEQDLCQPMSYTF